MKVGLPDHYVAVVCTTVHVDQGIRGGPRTLTDSFPLNTTFLFFNEQGVLLSPWISHCKV